LRFSCDRCGKRFASVAEPTPGRVYRVRCRCGNEIRITAPPQSPGAPRRGDARARSSEATGPRVDSPALPPPPLPPPAPRVAPPPETLAPADDPFAFAARADVFAGGVEVPAARADRAAAAVAPAPETLAPADDPFAFAARADAFAAGVEVPAARADRAAAAVAPAPETLAPADDPFAFAARADVLAGGVEVPAARADPAPAIDVPARWPPVLSTPGVEEQTTTPGASGPLPRRRTGGARAWLAVAVAAGAVLAVGAAALHLWPSASDEAARSSARETAASAPEGGAAAVSGGGPPAEIRPAPDADGAAAAAPATSPERPAEVGRTDAAHAGSPGHGSSEDRISERSGPGEARRAASVEAREPSAAPRKTEAAPPARRARRGLAPADLQAVLRQNREEFDRCVERALGAPETAALRGRKVFLVLLVAPDGRAEGALEDPEVDASPLGECLRRAVAGMAFPSFAGDPVGARVPLVIGRAE
jgi:hypothetical protein